MNSSDCLVIIYRLWCRIIKLNLDSISEPYCQRFCPIVVEPGVIVIGYKENPGENLGLSFPRLTLAFQLVPEFNNFSKDNALCKDGTLSPEERSDLLGPWMVGHAGRTYRCNAHVENGSIVWMRISNVQNGGVICSRMSRCRKSVHTENASFSLEIY